MHGRVQVEVQNKPEQSETIPDSNPIAVAPAEAARLAGICRTSLYSALATGELKSFHYGRRRLIRISALETWLATLEKSEAG